MIIDINTTLLWYIYMMPNPIWIMVHYKSVGKLIKHWVINGCRYIKSNWTLGKKGCLKSDEREKNANHR